MGTRGKDATDCSKDVTDCLRNNGDVAQIVRIQCVAPVHCLETMWGAGTFSCGLRSGLVSEWTQFLTIVNSVLRLSIHLCLYCCLSEVEKYIFCRFVALSIRTTRHRFFNSSGISTA